MHRNFKGVKQLQRVKPGSNKTYPTEILEHSSNGGGFLQIFSI